MWSNIDKIQKNLLVKATGARPSEGQEWKAFFTHVHKPMLQFVRDQNATWSGTWRKQQKSWYQHLARHTNIPAWTVLNHHGTDWLDEQRTTYAFINNASRLIRSGTRMSGLGRPMERWGAAFKEHIDPNCADPI